MYLCVYYVYIIYIYVYIYIYRCIYNVCIYLFIRVSTYICLFIYVYASVHLLLVSEERYRYTFALTVLAARCSQQDIDITNPKLQSRATQAFFGWP